MNARKFWFTLLGLALTLILGAIAFVVVSNIGSIAIHNASSHPLNDVSVTVQGKVHTFPNLDPGTSQKRWFYNNGHDGSFTFTASRGDGTLLREENGYITNHFGHRVTFRVKTDGGVEFTEQ